MKKWEMTVDGELLKIDEIHPEFAIQDSKASCRGEDLTMYREILGGINKFTVKIYYATDNQLEIIRRISRKPIVDIDIYNPMQGIRRQMKASVKCEKIEIKVLGDKEYVEPIEISFTQTGKDRV